MHVQHVVILYSFIGYYHLTRRNPRSPFKGLSLNTEDFMTEWSKPLLLLLTQITCRWLYTATSTNAPYSKIDLDL